MATASFYLTIWLWLLLHFAPIVFPSVRPLPDGSFADPDIDLAVTIASIAMLFFGALAVISFVYHLVFPRKWMKQFEFIYLAVEDKIDEATYWNLLRYWDAVKKKAFSNGREGFLREFYEKALAEAKQLTHES